MPRTHSPLIAALVVALLTLASAARAAIVPDVASPGDPIVGTSNNYPGGDVGGGPEPPSSAIDNNSGTKYLNFDKENSGFIVDPLASRVVGIALTTANDAPERDPASVTIQGSFDGSTYYDIVADLATPLSDTRAAESVFLFENYQAYNSYRVVFPTLKNTGAANSMQIGEVRLIGKFFDGTDITSPGDPIVAIGGGSPSGEGVANAIDDNAGTKYLNLTAANSGLTVTPAAGPARINGIALTTANDFPDRNPSSVTIRGSLDGSVFVDLITLDTPLPTTFFTRSVFALPEFGQGYLAYQVVFPTNEGSTLMQIAEVELLGEQLIDLTQPGDSIIGLGGGSPAGEEVDKAIDNNTGTKYLNVGGEGSGFQVATSWGTNSVLQGIAITTANDADWRDPTSVTILGSLDGVNFEAIVEDMLISLPTSRFTEATFMFENLEMYTHYRVLFPTIRDPNNQNLMQVAEVRLLGYLVPTPAALPAGLVMIGVMAARRRRAA